MNAMAMNLSVEVALSGSSNACFVQTGRKPLARWQLQVQHQVKHREVICAKWIDLIDKCRVVNQAGGKKYNVTLQVEAVSAPTSKTSTPNQLYISVSEVAAHSAPTPDQFNQKGQTLPSGEIPPWATKLNPPNQSGQDEPYQEAKELLMVQQSDGTELFIKVPVFFKDDAVALAGLLLIFFSIPLCIQNVLQEKPREEAILEMILFMVSVLLLQLMKGTNHLQTGMQITSNKNVLLLLLGSMGINGSHAEDFNENIVLSCAADGNISEEGGYSKAAALVLASVTIGGAAAWWMLKRRAASEFEVDRGLMESSVPTKSNPVYVIHPELAPGLNP